MCRLVTDFWLIVAVGAGMSHGYTVEINGTDRQTGGLMCACSICPNLTCFTDGACMSQIVRERRILARHDSCLSRADMFPKNHPAPYLCSSHEKTWETNIITCCNERDYCNLQNITSSASNALPVWLRSTTTTVATTTAMVGMSLDQRNAFIGIGAFLVFLIVLITLLTAILYRRSKTLKRQMRNAKEQARLLEEGQQTNGMLNAMMSEMTTTGSGSGLPLLVQLTVARQVTLVRAVGKGRFGEVFLGKWQGENVAVKIFRSHDEESWKREVEIYHTVMLRHENLLGFIAADNKDCGLTTQLWLITEYHEQGSLYDYLTRTTVDVPGVLRLCFSIANGLSHLHMEILGISALQITKPAIAHRDLKSKNILVKRNGQCVIADLGLAVAYVGVQGIVDVPPTGKVGSVRYLAPEVLDGTFRNRAFENYKAVDVYALALVIWEICSRLQFYGNTVQPYELPYSSDVRGDPDINQMREVVVTQKKRPSVANQWTTSEPMSSMCRIMKECWYANPHSRLTSLRVKKTIAQLIADEDVKL